MWVSTFHSACVRILRREATKVGLRSNFSIYDAADSQRLMRWSAASSTSTPALSAARVQCAGQPT
jgi:superfamily I DNA/RNA helicase